TPPLLVLNCCVDVNVKTETRGVTENPVPVPLRETTWGLPGALSTIARDELLVPVVDGVNVTLIVQLPFNPTNDEQLLVSEKSPALPLVTEIELIDNGLPPTLVNVTA